MKFGWHPDLPDYRDQPFSPKAEPLTKVDLRPLDTPIYNQGALGSCTANAIAAHLDFNRKKEGKSIIKPSRLFIYYNERLAENTVESDAGASIRDSVKEVKNRGAVPEEQWPYDISQFAVQPPEDLYQEAVRLEDISYLRLSQDLASFRSCLSEGYPFVGGITIYSSFPMQSTDGTVEMPNLTDTVMGGHALMFIGYDDSKQHFIVRNSWGDEWGDHGYFYLPYGYLINPHLARDFWSLRAVK